MGPYFLYGTRVRRMNTSHAGTACYSQEREKEGSRRMTQPTMVFRNAALDVAITDVLAHLVLGGRQRNEHGTSTLVFSGEGTTPATALQDALDHIREQCAVHDCVPVDIDTEPAFRIDTGTRIWGTISCSGRSEEAKPPGIAQSMDIVADQEGDLWTLTITAR